MFTPGNIIYAHFSNTNPPKPKYLIPLCRDKDLYVVACFTTSQDRAGVPITEIQHGKIKNEKGEVISYVFLATQEIGIVPSDGTPFKFPQNTVVRFDYCFQRQYQEAFIKLMKEPVVVGKLSKKEYLDLIYAMYQSDDVLLLYKEAFEQILHKNLG